MWRAHPDPDRVTCPACGRTVPRTRAREYDKYGDRFDRRDKAFEYLCRPCHDGLCHRERGGLESLLCDIGAGRTDRSTFLARFGRAVEGREERPGDGRHD